MLMKTLLAEGRSLVEAPKKTYAQAQQEIWKYLKEKGWTVNTSVKVPYATPPEGDLRVWFKTQAVYILIPKDKKDLAKFGDARSLHIPDLRQLDGPAFVREVEDTKEYRKKHRDDDY